MQSGTENQKQNKQKIFFKKVSARLNIHTKVNRNLLTPKIHNNKLQIGSLFDQKQYN